MYDGVLYALFNISPDEESNIQKLEHQLLNNISMFDDKEQEILKYRFGVDCGYPVDLNSTIKNFNIDSKKIRTLEFKLVSLCRTGENHQREPIDYLS